MPLAAIQTILLGLDNGFDAREQIPPVPFLPGGGSPQECTSLPGPTPEGTPCVVVQRPDKPLAGPPAEQKACCYRFRIVLCGASLLAC
jgi:hypothetical protein